MDRKSNINERLQDTRKQAKKLIKTAMLYRYFILFGVRIIIFFVVFVTYLWDKVFLVNFMTHKFTFGISDYGINFLHVLWFFLMAIMISHLIPSSNKTMALLKAKEKAYVEVEGYSRLDLLEQVQHMNIKAWQVMLIWLSGNAVFGVLYLLEIIDSADLLMLTVFYFLSDYICILLFCPFQTKIMKNKCCVNCRIYDWGHFMMFTPMLFIKNFFSWSLFFTAVVVLIHWEVLYAKHPERFWEKSNSSLQCVNCNDKTCQLKRRLSGQIK